MSFIDAAETVLREHANSSPMHYRQLTEVAIENGLVTPGGPTPEASMVAGITADIKKRAAKGTMQRFRAYGRGLYGLEAATDPALAALQKQNESVRNRLRKALATMDPKAFEILIGELLVAVGFEDVEVTKYSGDGGIDVRGRLAVGGVTNVQTAIQVKRWANNVQDKVVRELRGGLSTQERGLIITLSDFTLPAQMEGAKIDRVPISLVNGDQLLDLLIENEIGVSVKQVNVLELDEGSFDMDADEEETAVGSTNRSVGTWLKGRRGNATAKALSTWPLPGGGRAWIATLKLMLQKASSDQPTVPQAATWLVQAFENMNSENVARSYWKVPRQMGLVDTSGERLVLSELGAEYLARGNDAWLLQHLKTSYAGFDELLEKLTQGPASEEELLDVLREKIGVTWETTAQIKYRLGWLENLNVIHREGNRWLLNSISEPI